MPVAKLSREFYERFGDKVTDELVSCLNSIEASYRSELKDLFDAHFGRFQQLFEARLAATKADLEQQLVETKSELEQQLAATRADLRVEIRDVRAELVKCTAWFWVVVMLAVIGLYFKT